MNYPNYNEQNISVSAASISRFSAVFVHLIGVLLLLVGLWISLRVVTEAWELYRAPERIERFARAIERGSNIDKTFVLSPLPSEEVEKGELDRPRSSADPTGRAGEAFRASYFMAWAIALLLLMLIGRLALAAVKTGGELALYDTEVKRFAKALIREAKESRVLHRGEAG